MLGGAAVAGVEAVVDRVDVTEDVETLVTEPVVSGTEDPGADEGGTSLPEVVGGMPDGVVGTETIEVSVVAALEGGAVAGGVGLAGGAVAGVSEGGAPGVAGVSEGGAPEAGVVSEGGAPEVAGVSTGVVAGGALGAEVSGVVAGTVAGG